MSTTYEFDVDGVVRGVGDDAVEEELVVAAELLLDGGCREGKVISLCLFAAPRAHSRISSGVAVHLR